MFRMSRGDGTEDETAKSPEDDGVPGIETPDGVDRAATGSLPRGGPKALEGQSTDLDRSPEGSAIEPDIPLEQDYPSRSSSRQPPSNKSAAAAQRRSRSGALEGRANSGFDDRRGVGYQAGYQDRRAGPEDHRNGYEDRVMRSPAQRVVPKSRPAPQTPKPAVDTDKLATPVSFGKKVPKTDEPAVVTEDKAPAPPIPKRGWFSWGSKKTASSKALETNPPANSPESTAAPTPAAKSLTARAPPAGPLQNGLAAIPQVGTPSVGRLVGATPPVAGLKPQSHGLPLRCSQQVHIS